MIALLPKKPLLISVEKLNFFFSNHKKDSIFFAFSGLVSQMNFWNLRNSFIFASHVVTLKNKCKKRRTMKIGGALK